VTVSHENAGAITLDSVPVNTFPFTEEYWYDTLVTLSVTPAPGYLFAGWSGAVTSTQTTVDVTVDCTIGVAANFTPDPEVSGYQVYLSHITSGHSEWRDFLQVDNIASSTAKVWIVLYGAAGTQVYSGIHATTGFSKSTIDLKALSASAMTGVVSYSKPKLLIRLSQENTYGGGVAEFIPPDTLGSMVGFFYSHFTDALAYDGLAVANFGTSSATVTLVAMGTGGSIGTATILLGPNQKAIGTHDTWFPSLDADQVQWIRASSTSPTLAGVAITGNWSGALLVFTQALVLN
jgi:hypothetical protein